MQQKTLDRLHAKECNGCPFQKHWPQMQHPHMDPVGPETAALYVLGECPSNPEDGFGAPFTDGLARSFKDMMASAGLPEARFNNVARCNPPANLTWTPIESCRPSIERDILKVRPKVVLAVGDVPLKWIEPSGSASLWYKKPFAARIGDHSFWVMPVLDLWQLKTKYSAEPTREIYRTLEAAKRLLESPVPPVVHSIDELDACVHICMALPNIESVVKNNPPDFSKGVAADVETTGLKLHADQILTLAFTYLSTEGKIVTIATPIHHQQGMLTEMQKAELAIWLLPFLSKFATFTCHNTTFDIAFLSRYLGPAVWNWNLRDTMVQSFVLDTHPGLHSLDVCARLHLNIPGFKDSSEVDVTQLATTDLMTVLKYNARDVTATFILEKKLTGQLQEAGLYDTYVFHCRRLRPLSQTMLRGAPLNQDEIAVQKKAADEAFDKVWTAIMEDPRVKAWREEKGEFKITSWQQIKGLFIQHGLLTAKDSTDEESLSQVKDPLAKNVLEFRSQKRLRDFFTDLSERGPIVYSNFKNTSTRTARLSSSDINMQNLQKGAPRAVIRAPRGHVLVGADYKQLEAVVIANTAQDKYFMDALRNGLDVHAESGRELIKIAPKLAGKGGIVLTDPKKFDDFRGIVKNKWVFPAFYLASTYSLAGYMDISEKQAADYAEIFWQKFRGVKKWQQGILQQYKMTGMVMGPTGRRYTGIMTPNDLANYPIQGSASDIVVEAQNRCNAAGLIANINVHDELVFVVPRDEVSPFVDKLSQIMLAHPRDGGCKNFEWLKTPLTISIEVGIDWSTMKEIGSFTANW